MIRPRRPSRRLDRESPRRETGRLRRPRPREKSDPLRLSYRWLIGAIGVAVVATGAATLLQQAQPTITDAAVQVEPIGSAVLL